jgi:hypothetical protein
LKLYDHMYHLHAAVMLAKVRCYPWALAFSLPELCSIYGAAGRACRGYVFWR